MRTVEFDCVVEDGQACVFVYVGNTERWVYYPCEDEEAFLKSIEYLDAREEVLAEFRTMHEEFLGDIRHAEKALATERDKREDLNDERR